MTELTLRGTDLDSTTSPSLLLDFLWFFLYTFSCRRYVLLVFRSHSLIVTLYTVVTLVWPWEEVGAGPSYLVILATSQDCLVLHPWIVISYMPLAK